MSRYTLFESDIEELVNQLHSVGEDQVDPRYDYSGRGMYGATCLGFVVPVPHRFMLRLGRLLGQDELPIEIIDAFDELDVKTDSMGLDTIVYFPEIEVVTDAQR